MATTEFVSVPAAFRPALALLARLDSATYDKLAARLGATPNFAQVSVLAEAINDVMPAEQTGQSARLTQGLISLAPQMLDDQSTSLPVAISNAPELDLSDPERASLALRLESLLTTPAVATTAKALQLLTQHDRNYQSARVVSDIRPIFGPDVKVAPAGAVITQMMQLHTWSTDGETTTAYIAMDEADLRELRDAVDRALIKTQTLRGVLHEQGIDYFELDPRSQ